MSQNLFTTAAIISFTAVILFSVQFASQTEPSNRPVPTMSSFAATTSNAGHDTNDPSKRRCHCAEIRKENRLRQAMGREERLVSGFNDAGRLLLNRRTAFGFGHWTTVYGYPSTGGCYTLKCDGVELDFLGLSRFEPTFRSGDPDEEDAHCARMVKLGPNWWKSLTHYLVNQSFEQATWEDDVVIAGYPAAGGLWLLKTTRAEAADAGVAVIHNARNMEERCRLIADCGGRFFKAADKVPELVIRIYGVHQGRVRQ
ncbi:hypothetical protein CORC01_13198 [Colletotrichum orchidophilum]|uniref:Uncharacterized protein n=1 Tax=Colletotrichum orchidophilum TaxID=1209926 RepID=A0A1G4AR52_9PEZI|nr:uncharacterized protein CORC01_13198 [Colletotrichum orchidophilum]OHE91502.1 hypothetical protein CORC01_13198 [Colletotrichum orchidophilum]